LALSQANSELYVVRQETGFEHGYMGKTLQQFRIGELAGNLLGPSLAGGGLA